LAKGNNKERVRITKKVLVDGEWKMLPVATTAKGQVRWDFVINGNTPEQHTEGSYYLDWWEGKKRKRQCVGQDSFEVMREARQKQRDLASMRDGFEVPNSNKDEKRTTVDQAIDEYLEYIQNNRKLRTLRTYRPVLNTFKEVCDKTYVDELERKDMIDFAAHYQKLGMQPRTVYDRLVIASQFAKLHGKERLLRKSDWPSYVDTVRPIYDEEELTKFLAACSEREAILFKFYLMTGMRDQEVQHVTWRDVDFKNARVMVTAKTNWGFTPKNWEERSIPIPAALVKILQRFKPADANPSHLVFPNTRGNPDDYHCEWVKKIAHRAKLNCGQCVSEYGNKCKVGPYCSNWFLHKFRHTYATRHLQDGIDVRTLQVWMGHSDIQSTMVYLKGIKDVDAHKRISAGSLAAYA
jgi:integrase/recombinase XerD